MNPNEENIRVNYKELRNLTTTFIDEFKEKKFYNKNSHFRIISKIFSFFVLLYGIANLAFMILVSIQGGENTDIKQNSQTGSNGQNNSKSSEILKIKNEVLTYILFGLIFFSFIINFLSKEYASKFYFSILYLQFFLFSANHFLMGTQIINYNILKNIVNISSNNNLTNDYFVVSYYNINFVILFSDCVFKFLWILTPLNNFIFLSCTMIFNLIFVIIYLPLNDYFTDGENDSTSGIHLVYFLFYLIFCFLIVLASKNILQIKKLLFLHSDNLSGGSIFNFNTTATSPGNFNFFSKIKNLNLGYVKWANNSILDKNNFFEKEGEILRYLLKQKFDYSKNEMTKGETSTLNALNLQEGNKFNFSNIECEEIMRNLLFNITDKENLSALFQHPNSYQPVLSNLNNSRSNTQTPRKFTLLKRASTFLQNIELEVSCKQLLGNESIENSNFNFNNSNYVYEDICENIIINRNKFKDFTFLGKSLVTKGVDKVLAVEIYAKVSNMSSAEQENYNIKNKEYIEFILNDVSKNDILNGMMQFMIRTGQYLHDFKNPLICIQNEISELKDENEVMMAMIWKHNDYIENKIYKKIDIELDECLAIQEKFEYTKLMSEYCQNMIGSYEDFSKRFMNQGSGANIIHKNFDLLNLLRFIENMMYVQLSRSNKKIKFVLNFESLLQKSLDSFSSSNDTDMNDEGYIIGSDESKLKRVLINILSNAEKFTPSGSITLNVSKEIIDLKKYIKFTVIDTGLGMTKNDLDKLFTPFFSNNQNEMNKNGCGLGLLIVKEFTEKLGIGIKVSSKINEGTRMTFFVEDRIIPVGESTLLREKDTSNIKFIPNSDMNSIEEESNEYKEYEIDDNTREILSEKLFNSMNFDKLESFKDLIDESMAYGDSLNGLRALDTIKFKRNQQINFKRRKLKLSAQLNYGKKNLSLTDMNKILKKKSDTAGGGNVLNLNLNIFNSRKNSIVSNVSKNTQSHKTIRTQRTQKSNFFKQNSYSIQNLNEICFNEINFEILPIKKEPFSFRRNMTKNSIKKTCTSTNEHQVQGLRKMFESKIMSSQSTFASSKFFTNFRKNKNDNLVESVISENNENGSKRIKTYNILIIDDEKSIRSFCKSMFSKLEDAKNTYNVEEADDGWTGLHKIFERFYLTREPYDMIITDDNMNLIDGSSLFNILLYLINNDCVKSRLDETFLNKFVICSSDPDNVKSKIAESGEYINLAICEKPLNIEYVKNLI
jgi:signal transduction histidine kinase